MPAVEFGRQPSAVAKVFWAISLLCALGGGIIGFMEFASAKSAPQEAAAAAFGCLVAIAPYVVARSVDALSRGGASTAEPTNWRPLLVVLAVIGVAVVGIPAAVKYVEPYVAEAIHPPSEYSIFQDKEIAWHSRCDAFTGKTVSEPDRAAAEACRRDYDLLMTDGRAKGWRK